LFREFQTTQDDRSESRILLESHQHPGNELLLDS